MFQSSIGFPLIFGSLLGLAWNFPGEKIGAIFCILSAIIFCWCLLESSVKLRWIYLGGVLSHLIAFRWLIFTIKSFGGFGFTPALLIFIVFTAISGLQFFLAGWIARLIKNDVSSFGLVSAISWSVCEFSIFRIFPWGYGHSLLGFPALVQIADIGGSLLVTFVLFWVSESIVRYYLFKESRIQLLFPVIIFALSVSYGFFRIEQFKSFQGETQNIAVIQANINVKEKHDQSMLIANVERYKALSESIPGPDTLIIWPESVISDFIASNVGSVGNDSRLPFFVSNNPLLIGALTYNNQNQIFNSSLAILNSGTVLDPYNKQILMPFGEFMPLSGIFPSLKKLNPNIADFTPGKIQKVFEYPMVRDNGEFYSAAISPLICYEDVIANLARKGVQNGAEMLVSLSNDGWFGNTVAPMQHNLIASFRAIENRRFLVRSTNTGFTTIIGPTGTTIKSLPPFSEGSLLASVTLIRYTSLYTGYIGDWMGWILLLITITFIITSYQNRIKL